MGETGRYAGLRLAGRTFILVLFGLLAAALLAAANSAYALPVIPGASGYGMDTPAGRGGTVYKVTSLEDTNDPGTLRHAINQEGPRVVVFEVSGTIRVDDYLSITEPYITIAGQTAPSPGIFLRGANIRVLTHDVLIQHLRIAPGDDPESGNYDVPGNERDAIAIDGTIESVYNIVVDHVTMTWTVDEMFSTWEDATDITFRHVIASEALQNSIHVDEGQTVEGPHSTGPLFDNWEDTRVALTGSLLSHAEARIPMAMSTDYVQINNIFYDRGHQFNLFKAQRNNATNNTLIGNIYKNGPSLKEWADDHHPIHILEPYTAGGQFYLEDNVLIDHLISPTTQWGFISNESSFTQSQLEASSPPASYPGMTAIPSNQVMDWVLANAGARPADRLPYEERIVNQARNGTGEIIDTVTEAGGWPTVAGNTRTLTVPSNPNGDDDNDGYTNLEEWLHTFSEEVEGTSGTVAPTNNIVNLSVDSGATGAGLWNVRADLQVNDEPFADRTYTISSVPSVVQGADWIQPAADSKTFEGSPLAEFDLVYDSDVYVAFDDRTPPPSWLSSWTDTGQDLVIAAPSPYSFSLFKKTFEAGDTVSLGNSAHSTNLVYIPIVKALPAVNAFSVNSGADGAELWQVKTNLQESDLTYADRTYTFTSVPSIVQGADWIRPAADSQTFTGSVLAEFDVPYDSDVYIAFDDRTTPLPSWLSGWTDTGEDIVIATPGAYGFSLYTKSFPAGATVTLGDSAHETNLIYIPIVHPDL